MDDDSTGDAPSAPDADIVPPDAVGVDVGGTFTDFVLVDGGRLRVHKEPTSRPQHHAVERGLDALSAPTTASVAHGTTAATNALLERRGARTALLTTEGFADVLVIGRQNRADLYALRPTRPTPLVPADLRFGVPERLSANGDVLTPLDDDAVRHAAEQMQAADVESVAVVFLFAYQNSDHEARAAAILREHLPDAVRITRSSALLPEYREYERTATTVANAYVRPQVARYLDRLDDALGPQRIRVMQSNGGTIGLDTASTHPVRLALSGPAGGVVGALGVTRRALDTNAPRLITLDMGGTSTDVALCDGDVPRTTEHSIGGVPLRVPSTDIHTVGAGGGSVGSVDAGGGLRVGPRSAGADPGPACYGRGGTEPTVTDAHLVLGRLDPDRFLGGGGDIRLDPDAARDALASLGAALDLSPEAAALGVLRVANATMERALRRVSVERGHDPKDYVLVPFGGAGPLHAVALADALGVRRVLIPPAPGVLSALGLLLADRVFDASRAVLARVDDLGAALDRLRDAARDATRTVRDAVRDADDLRIDLELDLRYAGQSYELAVPFARSPVDTVATVTSDALRDAVDAFHARHRQRYGHADRNEPVEVVALRARGVVPADPPSLPAAPPTDTPLDDATLPTRSVWFAADAPVDAHVFDRARLGPEHAFDGPAIVHQYDSTIVIPPSWHVRVDTYRNLRIRRADPRRDVDRNESGHPPRRRV